MTGVFDLASILIRVECRKGKLFLPGTARYGCNTRRFLRNPATDKKRLSNSTYFLYRDLLGGTSAATHLFPKAQVNTRYCSQEKCHYAYCDDFFFSQAVILINCWTWKSSILSVLQAPAKQSFFDHSLFGQFLSKSPLEITGVHHTRLTLVFSG